MPIIKMDDGLGMSFGVDDRADDTFVLDAEVESLVFMLKGSYDFDIALDRFTPFLKGGIGIARNRSKNTLLDVRYDSLIWRRVSALWEMINWCIENPLESEALAADDPKMIALQAYMTTERAGVKLQPGKH